MDLEKLRVFVRVAQAGSLSAASASLGLGTSAISRQIGLLETESRGRLLQRTGRGVRLTELGERVLPRAILLLREADALDDEIAVATGQPRGTVHVASVPGIASWILPSVVELVRRTYPEVTMHLTVALTGQVEKWVAGGAVDLGFVLRAAPIENMEPVATVRTYLVGAPGDHLTAGTEIAFSRLDGIPLIKPSAHSEYGNVLGAVARAHGVAFTTVANVDSQELTKHMVARGLGYSLLSGPSIFADVEAGRLSASLVIDPPIVGYYYLLTPEQKGTSLASREVCRLVRQVAQTLAAESPLR